MTFVTVGSLLTKLTVGRVVIMVTVNKVVTVMKLVIVVKNNIWRDILNMMNRCKI